jgi:hypothetical protein
VEACGTSVERRTSVHGLGVVLAAGHSAGMAAVPEEEIA